MELGKIQEVIELLTPHLGDTTQPDGLHRLLARAYLKQDDLDHSLIILNDWEAQEKHNLQATYSLGLYQALIEPGEALKNLQTASKQNSEYSETYREIQTAINTAQLSDDNAYQAVVIGRAYANLSEWDLAKYAFLVALHDKPDYPEAHAWLGEARQHLGEDGSGELLLALELNPDSIIAQALYALYLQRQGKPVEALIYLSRIADTEPANPAWQIALGQVNAQLGKLEDALGYFQKAVLLEPENVLMWQSLAEFCFTYQYEVQASGIPAANKAVLLSPKSSRSLDLAAQAALTNGNLGSAEAYLRNALELDPRYAPAHLHLALVLLQQENTLEARQELEKAATLGNPEAENLLEQIKTP